MSEQASNPLPRGAIGFEIFDMVVVLPKDKLVFAGRGSHTHITVHFGPISGVLDIHATGRSPGGAETHTPLFSIRKDNLGELMQEFAPVAVRSARTVIRGLRVGWLARRGFGVALLPPNAALPESTKVRRRKLVLDPEGLATQLLVPEFLEELLDLPDGRVFLVLDCANRARPLLKGYGFKSSDSANQPHLAWIRRSVMTGLLKSCGSELEALAKRYGVFHVPLPWD